MAGERALRQRARRALAAVALLATAGCADTPPPDNPPEQVSCDRLPATKQVGSHLWRDGDDCIGWTVDTPYHFAETEEAKDTNDLIDLIIAKNQAIERAQKPFVRIAVLMPMTGDGAMLKSGIEDALRGVYVAQLRADDPTQGILGSVQLGIQVVLANEGLQGDKWSKTVDELVDPATSPGHPVIAVVGLGASLDETQKAAVRLNEAGMPAVGAVLTAPQITGTDATGGHPNPTVFHVAPSNVDLVQALAQWVNLNRFTSAFLVSDTNDPKHDLLLPSLHDALIGAFNDKLGLDKHYKGFNGERDPGKATPDLFLTTANNIRCSLHSQVVFYSGRSRDLDDLIDALTAVTSCDQPVTIAAITTGLDTVATAERTETMRQKHVSVVEAMVTDYQSWLAGHDTPPEFRHFYDYYVSKGFPPEKLADGYAIMHHDAMITVIAAARRLFDNYQGKEGLDKITAANIGTQIANIDADNPVPAASGALYFGDTSRTGGRPHSKPVPLIQWPVPPVGAPLPTYYTP